MGRLIYTDYVIFGSEKFLIPQSMYLNSQILNNFDCGISKYFHGNILLDWDSWKNISVKLFSIDIDL